MVCCSSFSGLKTTVKTVQIYCGTSLCKFLVSYWHRQREQGSSLYFLPGQKETDSQAPCSPCPMPDLPLAGWDVLPISARSSELQTTKQKTSSFLVCRERWEADIYERNHRRVILAHSIFNKKETEKPYGKRGLSLVNHCSCMQIQANIFGIYPVTALPTPYCLYAQGKCEHGWGVYGHTHTHTL